MSVIDRIQEVLVGNITFPFTNYLYNRRKINSTFWKLIETERKPQELIQEMQLRSLKSVLEYANRHIPFYAKRFRSIGMEPEDIKSLDDIKKIPFLTRQDVIDFHKDMVCAKLKHAIPRADLAKRDPGVPIPFARFRKYKLVRNSSSGSTGAPTIFYEDGSTTAINWAHEMRLKHWYGVNPGGKEARMVRVSTEYMPKSRVVKLRKVFWRQLLLPGLNLSDSEYEYSLEAIKEFQPNVVWGITSALTGLAQFIVKSGKRIESFRPKVVVGWAAPVHDHERDLLVDAFSCPVSNIYGSREVGHVAGMCRKGTLHVNQEKLLIETEPIDQVSFREGLGEILVTTLYISPMPFIRYRMGDVGEVADSRCDCGRTLKVIKNLLGRTGEIFISKEGRMISPNFWGRVFMAKKISGSVSRFQVVYKKSKDLKLIIEKSRNYSDETTAYIREVVAKNFSNSTCLEIEYASRIDPEISGKYKMVVFE